jgi:hypothetical protein
LRHAEPHPDPLTRETSAMDSRAKAIEETLRRLGI